MTKTRRSGVVWAAGLFALGVTGCSIVSACSITYGDLPATCDPTQGANACPSGYDCINSVCAHPGTKVPITIQSLQNLRSVDLEMVPQSTGVLVLWQIYHYDTEHHDFAAARLSADGSLSVPMIVVSQYPASSNYLEPYFHVLPTSDTELLMTMGAAPFDDAAEPRLTQFSVHLPPIGQEAKGATNVQDWELRMPTVGYGAVSEPRLVKSASGISLGYFESLTDEPQPMQKETVGELATFDLAADGTRLNPPPGCTDSSCCQANECTEARSDLPIAVSVIDAFVSEPNIWWILDDTRPSFVLETTGAVPKLAGADLPRLSVPVDASPSGLLFLQPSERTGRGLPDGPVTGPAALFSVPVAGMKVGAPQMIGELPGVRDSPRPAWIPRVNKPAVLVTPGTDVASPDIEIYGVDTSNANTTELGKIHRYSTVPISAVKASIVGGKLFVVWLDESTDTATIRGAVLDEP